MGNKNSDESRRKLLKFIAAGSGAIVAGKSLPSASGRLAGTTAVDPKATNPK